MTMKKLLSVLIVFLIAWNLLAQSVSVNIFPSNTGVSAMSTYDMLNFTIHNSSKKELNAVLQIQLESLSNNEKVVLQSQKFNLIPGITVSQQLLRRSSFLSLIYGQGVLAGCLKPDFRFYEGKYSLCINVFLVEATSNIESCDVVEISQGSQLLLISPFDGEEITTQFLVFSWINTNGFLNPAIHYRIKWVESKDKLNPNLAFNEQPLFNYMDGIKDFSLLYGTGYKKI